MCCMLEEAVAVGCNSLEKNSRRTPLLSATSSCLYSPAAAFLRNSAAHLLSMVQSMTACIIMTTYLWSSLVPRPGLACFKVVSACNLENMGVACGRGGLNLR